MSHKLVCCQFVNRKSTDGLKFMANKKTNNCIRFENISLLNSVIGQTLSIQKSDIGINDANSCCLITQDDFSRTTFTSVSPGKNIVTRFFNHVGDYSGGTEGLRFLVISKDLVEKIGRLKSSNVDSLSIVAAKKGLEIIGSRTENLEQVTKHKLVAKLYPGLDTDFGPIFRADDLLCEVSSTDFEFLVDTLLTFGGFSAEKQFETDIVTSAVGISIKNGVLRAVTANSKKCNQAHVEVSVPCTGNAEYQFNIEGFNLKSLKNFGGSSPVILSKTKEAVDGKDWVSFESQNGLITVRQVQSSIERVIKADLFGTTGNLATTQSIRACNVGELESSATIQEPSGINNTLLMSENKPHIQIQDSQDIGSVEFSLVDISTDIFVGDWSTILVNKDALMLACGALSKCFTYTEQLTRDILLVQKSIKKSSKRESPLISICPVNTELKVSVRFFCPVNNPEQNMDQLNSKD